MRLNLSRFCAILLCFCLCWCFLNKPAYSIPIRFPSFVNTPASAYTALGVPRSAFAKASIKRALAKATPVGASVAFYGLLIGIPAYVDYLKTIGIPRQDLIRFEFVDTSLWQVVPISKPFAEVIPPTGGGYTVYCSVGNADAVNISFSQCRQMAIAQIANNSNNHDITVTDNIVGWQFVNGNRWIWQAGSDISYCFPSSGINCGAAAGHQKSVIYTIYAPYGNEKPLLEESFVSTQKLPFREDPDYYSDNDRQTAAGLSLLNAGQQLLSLLNAGGFADDVKREFIEQWDNWTGESSTKAIELVPDRVTDGAGRSLTASSSLPVVDRNALSISNPIAAQQPMTATITISDSELGKIKDMLASISISNVTNVSTAASTPAEKSQTEQVAAPNLGEMVPEQDFYEDLFTKYKHNFNTSLIESRLQLNSKSVFDFSKRANIGAIDFGSTGKACPAGFKFDFLGRRYETDFEFICKLCDSLYPILAILLPGLLTVLFALKRLGGK